MGQKFLMVDLKTAGWIDIGFRTCRRKRGLKKLSVQWTFLNLVKLLDIFLASRCIPHIEESIRIEGTKEPSNLVLRHSVSIKIFPFPTDSGEITCWVTELNIAFWFVTRMKVWKYFLYWNSKPITCHTLLRVMTGPF